MERTKLEVIEWLEDNAPEVFSAIRDHSAIIAGGALRDLFMGDKPKDIDLFVRSAGHAAEVVNHLVATTPDAGVTRTHNAVTIHSPWRRKVQVITRWMYDTGYDVIESFDFTFCKAALRYDDGGFTFSESSSFMEDARDRRLVYASPQRDEDAAGSLVRVNRFLSRGYTIDSENFVKVLARARAAGDPAAEIEEHRVWTELIGKATRGY